jgi:hypothetical protein
MMNRLAPKIKTLGFQIKSTVPDIQCALDQMQAGRITFQNQSTLLVFRTLSGEHWSKTQALLASLVLKHGSKEAPATIRELIESLPNLVHELKITSGSLVDVNWEQVAHFLIAWAIASQ